MQRLRFDTRWFGDHGIGRFAREVYSRSSGFVAASLPGLPWRPTDVLTTTRYLRRERPDLFFTPGYNAPLGCPCPFALTVHDLNYRYAGLRAGSLRETYVGLGVSHRSGIFGSGKLFNNVDGGSNYIYTYVEWQM